MDNGDLLWVGLYTEDRHNSDTYVIGVFSSKILAEEACDDFLVDYLAGDSESFPNWVDTDCLRKHYYNGDHTTCVEVFPITFNKGLTL